VSSAAISKKFQFKYVSIYDLEKLSTLMEDGFDGLMTMYFSSIKELLQDLQKAITANNYSEIIRASHTIKSPSRQVGSIEVASKAEEIEILGRQKGDINEIETKFMILREQLEKANAEIHQYLSERKNVA
jgi:HPt (histidine-containing phosphotransfer) domain-containing protein